MISKFCKMIMRIRGSVKCIWMQAEVMVVKGYISLLLLSPSQSHGLSVFGSTNTVTDNPGE